MSTFNKSKLFRPFEHETYEDETPKDEALDEEGKTRVKLKVYKKCKFY